MKQIDKLLIRSFLPPFLITFFIALFVLIMQFFWLHVDDIIGKGVGLGVLVELIFYLSISLIPMALPIAILISSVMVMGNLAENFELTSMKSAGISLLRIMRPLIYTSGSIAVASFLCSNYIIPKANLQYKTRLADITKQKLSLSLETGVFNDDFKDFVIHIGNKSTNGKNIENVIIYDYSNSGQPPSQVHASKGEMYASDDGRHLIMNLFDGTQYQENASLAGKASNKYPFSRTSFKQWNKVFDLQEFALGETDTERYGSHYRVLSVAQLKVKVDTLHKKIETQLSNFNDQVNQRIVFTSEKQPINRSKNQKAPINKSQKPTNSENPLEQIVHQPLSGYQSIIETFAKKEAHKKLVNAAQSSVRDLQHKTILTHSKIDRHEENIVKHVYELNFKYSLAVICLIFIFIGAPMGAIVRKGGFGVPVLTAIGFFILFIVLNVFCKKLAESFLISGELAAWGPCLILLPVGLILTYRATNNSWLPRFHFNIQPFQKAIFKK